MLNWVDTNWTTPVEPSGASLVTQVLYSGNLGYTQGFETAIEAMRLLPDEVELQLVGDGNASKHVRRLVENVPRVHVRPPVAEAEFPALLGGADVQLASATSGRRRREPSVEDRPLPCKRPTRRCFHRSHIGGRISPT